MPSAFRNCGGTVEWLSAVLVFVTVLYAFDNYSQVAHRGHRTACSLGYFCVLEERAMKFLVDVFPYFSPLTYVSILSIFVFRPLRNHILFILSLNELAQGRKDGGNFHSVSSCSGEAKWFLNPGKELSLYLNEKIFLFISILWDWGVEEFWEVF